MNEWFIDINNRGGNWRKREDLPFKDEIPAEKKRNCARDILSQFTYFHISLSVPRIP
jgi:hypothetical protein